MTNETEAVRAEPAGWIVLWDADDEGMPGDVLLHRESGANGRADEARLEGYRNVRVLPLYSGLYIADLEHRVAEIARLTDEVERLRSELQFIAEIDPRDSSNGFNEWGEAECFRVAQERAKHTLAPAKKVD